MKKLVRLLLFIPILMTLIEPVHFTAAAAQASGPATALYLPLVNKDHDIWPAVVILNGYDPDYPNTIPTLNWAPISGAQFYQVRLVSLNNSETYEETVTTNWYEIWREGHWQVSVRAGDAFYWAPWSQPIVVTSSTVSKFDDTAPTDLFPRDQYPAYSAFPFFEWKPFREVFGRPYSNDTFEFQLDDDADFSSPLIHETFLGKKDYKMVKTSRMTDGFHPVSVKNVLLHPDIPYYWRVRQIFQNSYISNWSSATFTIEMPYEDCKPIPSGKLSFSISSGPTAGWPTFGDGWIDPYDPAIGAQQTFHVAVGVTPPQENPIQSVTVYGIFDSGHEYTYPATLVSGSALTSGYWEATYTVPESYCYNYIISVVAVNALGEKVVTLTLR